MKLISKLDTFAQPTEYILGTDAEAYLYGEALKLTSGRLTKCGPTDVPVFICMADRAAEATAITPIPLTRVQKDVMQFAAEATATVAATLVGQKVTLHTDGVKVTATTASGVAEIVSTDGATNVVVTFR